MNFIKSILMCIVLLASDCVTSKEVATSKIIRAPDVETIFKNLPPLDKKVLFCFDIDYTLEYYSNNFAVYYFSLFHDNKVERARVMTKFAHHYDIKHFSNKLTKIENKLKRKLNEMHKYKTNATKHYYLKTQIAALKEEEDKVNREINDYFMCMYMMAYDQMSSTKAISKLTDKKMVELVHLAKAKSKAMALTARSAEKQQHKNFYKNLKMHGIDFTTNDFKYHEISIPLDNWHCHNPRYYHGIIICAGNNKGKVLKGYLDYLKMAPSTVIFVDDRLKAVNAVEKVCKEMNINFIGFHYTAFIKKRDNISVDLMDKQWKLLLEQGKVVSIEELMKA